MSWAVGFIDGRDVGYGVPAVCDHPKCKKRIDRGLSFVCGGDVGGGEYGCGLFFCTNHLTHTSREELPEHDDEIYSPQLCERCAHNFECGEDWTDMVEPFKPNPDVKQWIRHKLTHESWQQWRDEHREEVARLSK